MEFKLENVIKLFFFVVASKLYDSCEIDDQCLTTIGCSKCENNTCVCAKGYHDVNYVSFSHYFI